MSRAAQQWARDWRFGAETAVGGEGVALGVVGVVVRRVIFVVVRWMDG